MPSFIRAVNRRTSARSSTSIGSTPLCTPSTICRARWSAHRDSRRRYVHAGLEAQRNTLHPVFLIGERVIAVDIRRAAAIGDDIAVEAPVVAAAARSISEVAGAGGNAVDARYRRTSPTRHSRR